MLNTRVLPVARFPLLPGMDEEPQAGGRALRSQLEGGWLILRGGRIATMEAACTIDFILLHREIGVALVRRGRLDYTVPALAVRAVRARLEQEGFAERFVGFLPVVWIAVEEDAGAALGARLARAFAAELPLELAGEGWVDFVADVLAPQAEQAEPVVDAEPPRSAATKLATAWRFILPVTLASCAAAMTAAAAVIAITLLGSDPGSPAPASALAAAASPAPVLTEPSQVEVEARREASTLPALPPAPQPTAVASVAPPAADSIGVGSTVASTPAKHHTVIRPARKPVHRLAALAPEEPTQVPAPSPKPHRSFWDRVVQPMPSHFEDHAGNKGAWTSR